MRGRAWMLAAALLVVIVGLVLLIPNQPANSPDHRSDSDAADGTSALYELSSHLDHPTTRMAGTFSLPDKPGIMVVFTPDTPYDLQQARDLVHWVSDGGTLIYADNAIDQTIAEQFSLEAGEAYAQPPDTNPDTPSSITVTPAAPVLDGVGTVQSSPVLVSTFLPSPAQVAALQVQLPEDPSAYHPVALLATVGQGRAFFLGDPLELCNGFLGKADNGRMAADLLAMAPAGSPVRFDEYHHGAGGTTASLTDWVTTPWGAAVAWVLVIVFVGYLWRSRAFGPRVSIASPRDRSSAEYASAVGTLLRRAGARELTWKVLQDATHRAVAERTGLGRSVPPDRVRELLDRRAPALADDLAEVDRIAVGVGASESRLLRAARRLHLLAYPSAKKK